MTLIDHETAKQFDRLPPHDVEAEKCVIASLILADAGARAQIRAVIDRGDFFQTDHQIIFDSICSLIDDGKPADEVTVRAELIRCGVWDEVGGVTMLADILNSVPGPARGMAYAEIVRERSRRRDVIALSNDLLRRAYEPSEDRTGDDLLQEAHKRIASLLSVGRSADYWNLGDLLSEVYDQLGKGGVPMVLTGIPALDSVTGGIGLGENVIVAARPSMGKSTILRQILVRAAKAGIPAGVISLEEGDFKIGRNILAAECGIENQKIRKANLIKEEWDELALGVARLSSLPVYGTNKARRLQDIRAVVTTWIARHGVKLVLVDYLQRIQARGLKEGNERVGYISRELADLWRELGVAAIVLAQLNRGVESREDKRPIMSDLRDSGGIEQDADGIVFLHREDYYHIDEPSYEPTGIAEFIIAKWRDGVRGKVIRMKSNLKYQCFEDYHPDPFRTTTHYRPSEATNDIDGL